MATPTPMDTETKDIDESLYSRQLYVLGHEAMKKMISSNVLLIGLKGLGVEIAKNLILGGVRSVSLLDDEPTQINDLGSQFYLSEAKVGVPRAHACVADLADLNRHVQVNAVTGSAAELLSSAQYQVVVVTERTVSEQVLLNRVCRKHNIGFISADIHGLFGSCFVDLGDNFVVSDTTGENPISKILSSISQDDPGVVSVLDESRHGLETGDYVTFEEVEGMVELNDSAPRPIKVLGPYTFSIENTTSYSPYLGGGRVRQVKLPKTVSFVPLEQSLANPELLMSPDMSKFSHPAQLHFFYQALSLFRESHGRFPLPTEPAEAQQVLELTNKLVSESENKTDIDDKLILRLARCSCASIAPMAAFMGGIVAQEVMKAVSGKFMPIKQHLYFDAIEVLPDQDLPPQEYAPLKSRYDDYIAVLGQDIQRRVGNLSYFLVGSGAIGCEMLKNWAMMGLATDQGKVFVTDMDTIEKSNLNRQFLFRNTDVGQLKSLTAARAVVRMNPSFQIQAQSNRVAPETQDIYDDDFWEGLDGVCTALDNVQARLYVDQRCVYYQKPLLESGTLGTKGNTQVVVPFLTESYGSTRDPPEQSFPICTLKNFPNQIEHTIQWARDLFEGFFRQSSEEVNSYLTGANYLTELAKQPSTQLETLRIIKAALVDERPLTFDECIKWARLRFEEEYNHKIRQLLHNFPVDSVTSSGAKFWSGPKRAPTPLVFDAQDPVHLDFIISAANLRAFNYGLQGSLDRQYFQSVLAETVVPDFVPKQGLKIAADDSELKNKEAQSEQMDDSDAVAQALISTLPRPASLAGYRLKPIEFEKDDDTNFHLDFITACSNLRARNYRIKEETRHQTKLIAGKIIPAIATTTALVTGLICLELYKLVQSKPIEQYRCSFANLALPVFAQSEPVPAPKKSFPLPTGSFEWSLWSRIDVNLGPGATLKQFIDHFQATYGLTINMISYGAAILYSFFGNKKKIQERMAQPLAQVAAEVSKTEIPANQKYLILEASVNDDDDNDVEIPYIRVRL
eukprot:TRINITY_DN2271_c0_g2_i1.p1 TRINITY_DN2271_c0_g2~~TRINITY_DN2271_c0_g2_i1.p1  ORF type:complete len:1029 (-),score=470.59 TRINITY_DN2271_c0_g2_i1:92-3154(-)